MSEAKVRMLLILIKAGKLKVDDIKDIKYRVEVEQRINAN